MGFLGFCGVSWVSRVSWLRMGECLAKVFFKGFSQWCRVSRVTSSFDLGLFRV